MALPAAPSAVNQIPRPDDDQHDDESTCTAHISPAYEHREKK
jgi:hypothetical protein